MTVLGGFPNGLTDEQARGIEQLTDANGDRWRNACGSCGRETEIHVDGVGKVWWLCGDCLARRLDAVITGIEHDNTTEGKQP